MNRKSLIFLSLLVLLNLVAAQNNSNSIGDVLWYIGFGVGLILLAFVSETAYKLFSSLYVGGADIVPSGGKIDRKADLKSRNMIMGQIGSAEKKRENDWERAQMAQLAKSLFRMMIYKNSVKLSDASKDLGTDIVNLSRAALDLKHRGLIEISGDRIDPDLKATKLLLEKVRELKL